MHVHAACFTKNVSTHDKAKTNNSSSSVVEHSARNIATTTTTSCSIAVTGTRLTPRCNSSSPFTPFTCLFPLQFPFPFSVSLAVSCCLFSFPLPWSLQCKQAPAEPNNNSLGQLHTHIQRGVCLRHLFMPAATSTFTSVSASASASTYTGAFALLCSTAVWLLFHASFLVCLLFLLVSLPFPSPLFLVSLLFPQFLLLLRFFRTTSELSIVARQSSRNNCSYKVRINTHCHRAEVGDNQTERGRKRGRARDSTSEAIGKNKVRSCSWDDLLTTLSLVFARAKKRTQ